MSLIKADLIDQVALAADLTRVRAEMATEAVIESFKEVGRDTAELRIVHRQRRMDGLCRVVRAWIG